jgi:bifunctional NMN adenylyltransferase/nudix hydrolase
MALIPRAERAQDICVFIGRFQPLHMGHRWVILRALELAEFVVIVIGSANAARRPDLLPFTETERAHMIWDAVPGAIRHRVHFVYAEDSDFNTSEWTERVYRLVKEKVKALALHRHDSDSTFPKEIPDSRISLIGHAKDKSSYYLRLFPQWSTIDVISHKLINATDIRLAYFSKDPLVVEAMFEKAISEELLHTTTVNWLRNFQKTPTYAYLVAEQSKAVAAREVWEKESFPGSRNTIAGDAMIHQNGYVLLIKRGEHPFEGLWALPGGHLNTDETVLDCALREGYEETKIKVPRTVFERSLVTQDYFDAPRRDPRGRYISHVFLFDLVPPPFNYDTTKSKAENERRLRDSLALPKVRAADDAKEARWWHLSEITRPMMAFDHYSVIRKMSTRLPKGD